MSEEKEVLISQIENSDKDPRAISGILDEEVMEVCTNLNTLYNMYDFSGAQLNQLSRFKEFSKDIKFPGIIINPNFSPSRIKSCIDLTLGLKTDDVGISERYDVDHFINYYIQQVVSDKRLDDEEVELMGKLIYAIFTNDSAEGYDLEYLISYIKQFEASSILEITRYIENGFILDLEELDDISNEEFFARRIKMLNERYQQMKASEDDADEYEETIEEE